MKKFLVFVFVMLLLSIQKSYCANINVAYTIDNNYPIFTLLSINSILKNNLSKSHYKFYIFENNVTDKNKELMRNFVHSFRQEIEFYHIDTYILDQGQDLYKYLNSRITSIGMARVLIPNLLPDNIHRVLYLDGDTLITDDLKNLYDMNLKDKTVGMVEDSSIWQVKQIPIKKQNYYVNSGVMLIDIDKWRKEHITEQIISFLKDNFNDFLYKDNTTFIRYPFPDQDLINIVLKNNIAFLDKRWNNQTIPYFYLTENTKGIIHFLTKNKPWVFPQSELPAYKIYYKYWRESPLWYYKYYYSIIAIRNRYIKTLSNSYKKIKNGIRTLLAG